MDRSLWLLLRLRVLSRLRLWLRGVRTLKGLLQALVGALLFAPILVAALFAPRIQTAAQLSAIRTYGPLALFAFCVLNVMLSPADRAVTYSPAEVNFLFCGPYRPRQLLLYKVAGGVAAGLLTALFMTCVFAHHGARFLSVLVGLFLAVELLFLFSLTVGLVISTFGVLAFSRGRRVLLLAVACLAAAALWPLGRQVFALAPGEVVDRALRSPTLGALLVPFRPCVMAFTSQRFWPDLAFWSGLSFLVDLGFLALVLGLNAQFLEASAAASARVYARLQRARRGEALPVAGRVRFALPMFPWWGGVGPNAWRQSTSALRSPVWLAGLLLFSVVPVAVFEVLLGDVLGSGQLAAPALTVLGSLVLFGPSVVAYDFRPDLGRMEVLKTLPIRPARLVLGQLMTPVVILSAGQWLALALILATSGMSPGLAATAAVLSVPVNLLLVAIENLYFLWYPFPVSGVTSFDFRAIGRQVLLALAKGLSGGVATVAAGGLAALAYWVTGGNWLATIAAAFLAVSGCGLGLVLLVALAFEQFDVAGPLPD